MIELDKELGNELNIYIYKQLVKEKVKFLKNWENNNIFLKDNLVGYSSSLLYNLLTILDYGEKLRLKAGIPNNLNKETEAIIDFPFNIVNLYQIFLIVLYPK